MADYTKADRDTKWWTPPKCGTWYIAGIVRSEPVQSTDVEKAGRMAEEQALELAQHFLDKIVRAGCPTGTGCEVMILGDCGLKILHTDLQEKPKDLWTAIARVALVVDGECVKAGSATPLPPDGHIEGLWKCGDNRATGWVTVTVPKADGAAQRAQDAVDAALNRALRQVEKRKCPRTSCPRLKCLVRSRSLLSIDGTRGDVVSATGEWTYVVECLPEEVVPKKDEKKKQDDGEKPPNGDKGGSGEEDKGKGDKAKEVKPVETCPDPGWLMPAGTAVATYTYGLTRKEQTDLETGKDTSEDALKWAASATAKADKDKKLAEWLAEIQKKCGKCKAAFDPDPPKISTQPKAVSDLGNKIIYALVLEEDLHGRCVPR